MQGLRRGRNSKMTFSLMNMVDIIKVNDKRYFWAKNCNGFFSNDVNSDKCELVFRVDADDNTNDRLMFSKCLCVNDSVWLAPYNEKRIVIYNLKNKSREYIDLQTPGHFFDACAFGEEVFFIGSDCILQVNVNKRSVERIVDNADYYVTETYRKGDLVYFNTTFDDMISCLNLRTKQVYNIELPPQKRKYGTITGFDNYLVLSGENLDITFYSLDTKEMGILDLTNICKLRDNGNDRFAFIRSNVVGNRIVFSPAICDSVIYVECGSRKADKIVSLRDSERSAAFFVLDNGTGVIVFEDKKHTYEVTRQCRLTKEFEVKEENVFILPNDVKLNMRFVFETHVYNLERFILNV